MRYRIEHRTGERCRIVKGRKELLNYLRSANYEVVTDIRKVYKNGISDSVLDTYRPFLKKVL